VVTTARRDGQIQVRERPALLATPASDKPKRPTPRGQKWRKVLILQGFLPTGLAEVPKKASNRKVVITARRDGLDLRAEGTTGKNSRG
jgi:hypothetical protein